jgi:hypothetical protein
VVWFVIGFLLWVEIVFWAVIESKRVAACCGADFVSHKQWCVQTVTFSRFGERDEPDEPFATSAL